MSNASRHCHTVRSYEKAETLFKTIKPVITRTRQAWGSDVRPLYDGAARAQYKQFRLRKNSTLNGDCYDVILYGTVIARYYKPAQTADGKLQRTVLYNAYESQTTYEFMWHVLGRTWRQVEITTTGSKVMVPTAPARASARFWDGDTTFTLRRVLVETAPHDFKLDTEQSFHVPFYTRASSAEDRAKRKEMRQRVETLMDLVAMRLPQFEADAAVSYRMSPPFSSVLYHHHFERMRGLLDLDIPLDDALTSQSLECLMVIAQILYDRLASIRARKESGFKFFSGTTADALEKPVTEEDLRKALMAAIMKRSGLMQRSDKKMLPMWADPSLWPARGVCCE